MDKSARVESSPLVVTGGTGFVGKQLVAHLLQEGCAVTVLSRSAQPAASNAACRHVTWDPSAPGPWQQALDGAHAVIHLAGEPVLGGRWTQEKRRRIYDSRVRSTEQLVRAIEHAHHPPSVLVSASAIGWYGLRAPDDVLDESSSPGHDFLAEVTRDWEQAALRAESLGVRVVNVRIGIVLGPQGGALAQMLPVFRAWIGGPLGDGKQIVSWIHQEDLVQLFSRALHDPKICGPLNATAPHPVTMNEFAQTLGSVLHRPARLAVPGWALKALWGDGPAQILLGGQYVLPRQAQQHGFVFRYPNLEIALRSLLA